MMTLWDEEGFTMWGGSGMWWERWVGLDSRIGDRLECALRFGSGRISFVDYEVLNQALL